LLPHPPLRSVPGRASGAKPRKTPVDTEPMNVQYFKQFTSGGSPMLLRSAATVFLCAFGVLSAADSAKPREESMKSDRFAEAHAPLFSPPKSQDAGALTQKVAGSLPPSAGAAVNVPVNGFIDKFIFAKIAK